jgi:hypothetical protein
MKKFGRLIIAGGILVLLLAWVLAKDRGRVAEKDEAFKLQTEQVSGLQVKTDMLSLSLRKEGEQWLLAEPVKGWADKDAAERAVKAMAQLKPTGSRDKDGDKPLNLQDDKWGLKKPALTATLTYDGNRTVTLYLGKQTLDSSEYFARIEGKNKLYLVPTSVYGDLTQAVDALRDKSLVHLKKEDIKSLTLQYPDRVLSVDKRGTLEEPRWFLTQPYEAKADEWSAKTVAEKLADLKADGFAPETPAAGKSYGFDKPTLKATLTTTDGKQFVLTFGVKGQEVTDSASPTPGAPPAATGPKDIVYVQVAGRPEVLLVADSNMTELQKTDMDLRDKRLLDIKKEQVRQIKVERKQGLSFSVERSGPDTWRLVTPSPAKANKTKVEDLLWNLTEVEAKEFLGEQKDLMKYGLAVADIIYTLTVDGRAEPIKLYIGYKKVDGVYYCRTSLSSHVYAIGEMPVVDLPKSLEDLKDTGAPTGMPPTGMPPNGTDMPMMPPPSMPPGGGQ